MSFRPASRPRAPNSPADLFWTVDGGRLHRAVEAGIFQPVESDVLNARIPADLRHPDGLHFSLTSRARVIYYNAEAGMPEGVTTYEDLARDDLGLSVCIRTSSNIYNVSLMAEMVHVHGEEDAQSWAEGLKGNLAREPQGGDTDQIRALAAGECDLAVANTYYWGRLQTSSNPADREVASKVLPIFPNQDDRGTHVNVSGIGVVANAPERGKRRQVHRIPDLALRPKHSGRFEQRIPSGRRYGHFPVRCVTGPISSRSDTNSRRLRHQSGRSDLLSGTAPRSP